MQQQISSREGPGVHDRTELGPPKKTKLPYKNLGAARFSKPFGGNELARLILLKHRSTELSKTGFNEICPTSLLNRPWSRRASRTHFGSIISHIVVSQQNAVSIDAATTTNRLLPLLLLLLRLLLLLLLLLLLVLPCLLLQLLILVLTSVCQISSEFTHA